jgi:hypothetical protein
LFCLCQCSILGNERTSGIRNKGRGKCPQGVLR